MSAVLETPVPDFRPMREEDIAGVLAIEDSAYTHPWGEGIFLDCLRVGYSCWLMEREEEIIAYGVMSIAAGESHLLNLCVKPQLQNMGYGRMMLDYLLDLARQHKADMAFLEVRPSNRYAIKLYRNSGFDEVGMRRNYYPAIIGREDAIILARSLV